MTKTELITQGGILIQMYEAVFLNILAAGGEELSWKEVEAWLEEQKTVQQRLNDFMGMAKFEITNASKDWTSQWDLGFKFYDEIQQELIDAKEPMTEEEMLVRAKAFGICDDLAPSLVQRILNPEDE